MYACVRARARVCVYMCVCMSAFICVCSCDLAYIVSYVFVCGSAHRRSWTNEVVITPLLKPSLVP